MSEILCGHTASDKPTVLLVAGGSERLIVRPQAEVAHQDTTTTCSPSQDSLTQEDASWLVCPLTICPTLGAGLS